MSGGLEEAHVDKAVCDILEGGEKAFRSDDYAKRRKVIEKAEIEID